MKFKKIQFEGRNQKEFFKTVRSRVDEYFKSNNLSRAANTGMVMKTIFMLILYFLPFAFILSGVVSNYWILLLLWAIMGIGGAGVGLSVMHDANHGSYSKSKKVNKALGYLAELIGASSLNWRIQHNVLHHTYTNIQGMDEDIDSVEWLLRFSPHSKLYKIHRLQHFYAWFLYGIMTIFWVTARDFIQLARYKKKGLIKRERTTYTKALIQLIAFKLLYYSYTFFLPLLVLDLAWWQVLIGFLLMHVIASLILTSIFQPAHVMETSDFPLPNSEGKIEEYFAVHEMRTTTNFAPESKLFSWYVGGLNFQIEHHLFPNICHVHYRKLSPIVKRTAKEFGVPYNVQPSFFKALVEHGKMLKRLGRVSVASTV